MNTARANNQKQIQSALFGLAVGGALGVPKEAERNCELAEILPLLFDIIDKPLKERFKQIRQISFISHGQIHSAIACFYYLEFARLLAKSLDMFEAYSILKKEIPANMSILGLTGNDLEPFYRLLEEDIFLLQKYENSNCGSVIEILEASIWCLLTTGNYTSAVLKAVNLGKNKEKIAAVTGGLAGLSYGYSQIPGEWVSELALALPGIE
ncbi:MAG: ADP-ribosylglycohydrolase family protein [Bacteroidales bacterium]